MKERSSFLFLHFVGVPNRRINIYVTSQVTNQNLKLKTSKTKRSTYQEGVQ
ncbi:hypothetical protein NBO_3g0021 [Nosema bombycis CQ1]|uniref:Uncharacterized protein n=1 Tax=Nosema bombycis (strain CQ1 / CVCC 102059) TaxID=578461 RepID=R0MMN0_NOSB1|nr:hypothetical protein NBO_3g0021 [Nosema bombycis CQ1]|eukprot:EOB15470.1 hypothetical protein NBO_3g0021 [Nosema bombycis CQ1]